MRFNTLEIREFLIKIMAIVSPAHCDDIFWRVDEDSLDPITFFVKCTDVFELGGPISVMVSENSIQDLERAYKDSKDHGAALFCCRRLNAKPREEFFYRLRAEEFKLFSDCGA